MIRMKLAMMMMTKLHADEINVNHRASNNRQPIATKPSGLRRILSKMRRSNSGHSLQERTNSLVGENENNNGVGNNGYNNGLGNGYNNNSLAEEVKESNGWDGGRASITFSPHRFAIKRFKRS